MDRVYARLRMMLEPAPPHKLPSIENIRRVAFTIELMRPLAVEQSLNQLFNLFTTSHDLILGEEIEDTAVKDLNQATIGLARLALSAARTHPTQTPSVRNPSSSLKFLVTHLELLLRGEPHYETIEAILWSLDPAAAPRELFEGYFIPELNEEIDQVVVSPVFVKGFCALFGPSVPSRTKESASSMFQSWLRRWMQSMGITWQSQRVPMMGDPDVVKFCQNLAVPVDQSPVDRDSNTIVLLTTLLWMMSLNLIDSIPDSQYQLLCHHTKLPWGSPMLVAALEAPIFSELSRPWQEGLKLWTAICWIHEQDLPQLQRDMLGTVTRQRMSPVDNRESFEAIIEAQERIKDKLRLYENEPGNPKANELRARKEGMDCSKERLRQAIYDLGN